MKKYLYSVIMIVGGFLATSCDDEFLGKKDEVGGTATEETAGEWYVWADGIDAHGEVIPGYEDFFGERFFVNTFNTAENVSNKMFVQEKDLIRFQVECDVKGLSFDTDSIEDVMNGKAITIKNGIIIKDGGHQNNGSKADSISFEVYYPNADEYYIAAYGHAGYLIRGIRYSGLKENDD